MGTFLELLVLGLEVSSPIAFASIGGVFSEKSGIINIGLEGIMIFTSFAVVWGGLTFQSFGAALIAALIAGMLMASVHALATVTYRVDHIVSGVSINILALGVARFLSQTIYGQETQTPQNPFVPPELFGVNIMALALIPIAFLAWFVLRRTIFGLRLRSVGENPQSADTLGVNVYFYRYAGVILSGLMCGFAATTLYPTQWVSGMTGGRGFIALAAMIFGRWHPVGAMLAAMLFGFAEAARIMFETAVPVPGQFVQMFPYVLAVVVLAGLVGKRARGPAATGTAYEQGQA
jgi:simple sugar transport system permease protein